MLDKFCPFCEIAADEEHSRIVSQNQQAFVIHDGFPVSNGHTLVISKQHIGSFFDLSADQRQAMLALLELSKNELDKTLSPKATTSALTTAQLQGKPCPIVICI
jgi:diadenosine tetraphosphate (Ap4A) HIT family hydrolase